MAKCIKECMYCSYGERVNGEYACGMTIEDDPDSCEYDQIVYDKGLLSSNTNEHSTDKQDRLNCNVGIGVNDWNCYRDCAFWDGEKCTNHET